VQRCLLLSISNRAVPSYRRYVQKKTEADHRAVRFCLNFQLSLNGRRARERCVSLSLIGESQLIEVDVIGLLFVISVHLIVNCHTIPAHSRAR